MSKIHPILMNTAMVRATLEDLKTQTRRVVTPQPPDHPFISMVNAAYCGLPDLWLCDGDVITCRKEIGTSQWKPKYQPGDILWVRETWREWHSSDSECGCGGDYCTCGVEPSTPACYKADGHIIEDEDREMYDLKWTPSIHMPKWACRLFLRVTDVRVERLQNLSRGDAAAEGLECVCHDDEEILFLAPDGSEHGDPRCAFMRLWDSLAKSGFQFNDNPWVWVYEFEKCDKPEGWCDE